MMEPADEIQELNGRPGRKVNCVWRDSRPADNLVPDIFRDNVALGASLGEGNTAIAAIVEVVPVKYLNCMRILKGDVGYRRLRQGQWPMLGIHGDGVCLIKSKSRDRTLL